MCFPLSQATHPVLRAHEARCEYLKRRDSEDSFLETAVDPRTTDLSADSAANPLIRSGQGDTQRGRFRSSSRPPRTPSIGRRSRLSSEVAASRADLFGQPAPQPEHPFTHRSDPLRHELFGLPRRADCRLLPPRPRRCFQRGCRGGRSAPSVPFRILRAPPSLTRARRRCLSPISATDYVVNRAPLGPTDPRATSSHSPVRRGSRAPRGPHTVFAGAVREARLLAPVKARGWSKTVKYAPTAVAGAG